MRTLHQVSARCAQCSSVALPASTTILPFLHIVHHAFMVLSSSAPTRLALPRAAPINIRIRGIIAVPLAMPAVLLVTDLPAFLAFLVLV